MEFNRLLSRVISFYGETGNKILNFSNLKKKSKINIKVL